jgi:hypothetical protein
MQSIENALRLPSIRMKHKSRNQQSNDIGLVGDVFQAPQSPPKNRPAPPQTQTQTQAPESTMRPPPDESTGKTEGNVFYLANCLLNLPAYFVILTRRFQFGIVRRPSNLLFNFTRYIVSFAFCRVPDAWFHNCASSCGHHLNSTGVECDPRTRCLKLLAVPCDTDFDLLRFRLLTLRHAHGQNPVVIVGANKAGPQSSRSELSSQLQTHLLDRLLT